MSVVIKAYEHILGRIDRLYCIKENTKPIKHGITLKNKNINTYGASKA